MQLHLLMHPFCLVTAVPVLWMCLFPSQFVGFTKQIFFCRNRSLVFKFVHLFLPSQLLTHPFCLETDVPLFWISVSCMIRSCCLYKVNIFLSSQILGILFKPSFFCCCSLVTDVPVVLSLFAFCYLTDTMIILFFLLYPRSYKDFVFPPVLLWLKFLTHTSLCQSLILQVVPLKKLSLVFNLHHK